MTAPISLRGIAWNHSRGFTPKVAVAQRFHELHPHIEITWEKRSLKHFGEYPVGKLAEIFDLLIIDHPYVGYASAHSVFLPLDEIVPKEFIADLEAHSVGLSFASYQWDGKLWALPVDAACATAAWRPDILDQYGVGVPKTWEEMLELARRGAVDVSMEDINVLMNFYTACIAHGEEPFLSDTCVISDRTGVEALKWLKDLAAIADPHRRQRNPIQSLNFLGSKENTHIAYALFPYSYSNYSRDGYADFPVIFGELPSYHGRELVTPIGGTGIAISAKTKHPGACAAYAQFLASPRIQKTLYTQNGGQPAHRIAWLDMENNRLNRDFFTNTLALMDRAYLRPRYLGYDQFQEQAGSILSDGLYNPSFPESETLALLGRLYRETRHNSRINCTRGTFSGKV